MFAEDSFGVFTFADTVILIAIISYSPTKMKTRVTLLSPSGKIISIMPSFKLKTQVSILSSNKLIVSAQ